MGIAIRFPTEWLFGPVDQRALCDVACDERGRLGVPIGFIDGVRQILMLNLQDRHLGLDQVARLSGMSQQSLQRKLKASGTTFSAEIRKAKKRHAEELLSNTNLRVTEIAQSVGFSDPTSFTRAFHSWTGKSPRVYRKKRPIRPGDPGDSMT